MCPSVFNVSLQIYLFKNPCKIYFKEVFLLFLKIGTGKTCPLRLIEILQFCVKPKIIYLQSWLLPYIIPQVYQF